MCFLQEIIKIANVSIKTFSAVAHKHNHNISREHTNTREYLCSLLSVPPSYPTHPPSPPQFHARTQTMVAPGTTRAWARVGSRVGALRRRGLLTAFPGAPITPFGFLLQKSSAS